MMVNLILLVLKMKQDFVDYQGLLAGLIHTDDADPVDGWDCN